MRQLVTIREVSSIEPILNSDNLELAHIDGWQCVVKKNEFKPGDKGLYFEIDSVLPSNDERFAFLASKKFRVKTIKLRGVLSQGLLMPRTLFTDQELSAENLSKALHVIKYEPPMSSFGNQKGLFPSHLVPKTDQERIQNIPAILNGRRLCGFEVTEKLDGCSCTIWFHSDGSLDWSEDDEEPALDITKNILTGVASRNFEMQKDDDNAFTQVFRQNNLREKLWRLKRNIAIQGEIIGPKIQGNKYKRSKIEFYVFDIYDIDGKRYLNASERYSLVKDLELLHVPVLEFEDQDLTLKSVLDIADGKSVLADIDREGLVFKDFLNPDISFKAISNKWLLKNE